MTKPLLCDIKHYDINAIGDLVLIMAKNIEQSLIDGGATPGDDYTIRDLYNWAMPFALDLSRKNDRLTYVSNF
ncbi:MULTISPECIES: hypothetical protein [unclassified Lysobacter]|uniref:hypothetical protein n=1 Tax=unclassified Lysobacter TaxID=2635362 RepID=UPI001BE6B619|nr:MULTISPECIES: hypothetical protein [unclassified Lysobacter]MBT2748619.1 hypothetical protein [Lysobacter sp. ISL-42]MBT2751554.1 hypothetical protein [Lysobacter sp. ISL-50]MBT2775748.1 hypothetical protein [Lysobacter sp. ISL-54]MBT2782287.1 hypothetical protein [Lysobacter sp. ISL-52]